MGGDELNRHESPRCRGAEVPIPSDVVTAKTFAADTPAKYGIEADIGYISTGGGAFLEVLEGKILPAFEILQERAAG